jgi:hypothetical protein
MIELIRYMRQWKSKHSKSGQAVEQAGHQAPNRGGERCRASKQQNHDRRVVAPDGVPQMPPDQEFLLYPLDTGEDPLCDRCRLPMLLAGHEVRVGKLYGLAK